MPGTAVSDHVRDARGGSACPPTIRSCACRNVAGSISSTPSDRLRVRAASFSLSVVSRVASPLPSGRLPDLPLPPLTAEPKDRRVHAGARDRLGDPLERVAENLVVGVALHERKKEMPMT